MTGDKTTYFYPNKTLRLGQQMLNLSTPAIMGILNVTPDSFFDGGKYAAPDQAVRHAEKLINELIANGKQFQLMSYPNRTHGISEGRGTTAHLQQLYTDYLRMYCPPGAR